MDVVASLNCDPKILTPLCDIMYKYGSDKGKGWHNYTTFYHSLFKSVRMQPLRIFELGLGTNNVNLPSNMGANGKPGASVYGWREYFPNAQIYGGDIDRTILFEAPRIQTRYCDQTNAATIAAMWADLGSEQFDIIIEDGLHEYEANMCFLRNSWDRVKPGGVYIIEDLLEATVAKIKNNDFDRFTDAHVFQVDISHPTNPYDNRLIVLQKTGTGSKGTKGITVAKI